MKILFPSLILTFLLSFPLYPQETFLDTLVYTNGSIEAGEVIKVSETTVDFKMQSTQVVYEISKKKIKEIRLKNGRIIEFNNYDEKLDTWDSWERETETEKSSPDTFTLVLAVTGMVLIILFVIGSLAQ